MLTRVVEFIHPDTGRRTAIRSDGIATIEEHHVESIELPELETAGALSLFHLDALTRLSLPRLTQVNQDVDLYELDLRTLAEKPIVAQPGRDADPSYSPDGKWIAFHSQGGTLNYFAARFFQRYCSSSTKRTSTGL